jgi:hypothetical protein
VLAWYLIGAVPIVQLLCYPAIFVEAQGRISELIYLRPSLRNYFSDGPNLDEKYGYVWAPCPAYLSLYRTQVSPVFGYGDNGGGVTIYLTWDLSRFISHLLGAAPNRWKYQPVAPGTYSIAHRVPGRDAYYPK